MTGRKPNAPEEGGEAPSRARRLLRSLKGPIAAALLGAFLGMLCKHVPQEYQDACEVASHVLPNSCVGDSSPRSD